MGDFLDKGRALVVVAHPDDETIWMGGAILANPQVKWTCLSLCRADDKDRAPKFRRVCEFLGAKSFISDLDDEERLSLRESLPEIHWRLSRFLTTTRFDFVFTHGYNGEYGHPRHKGAHRVVKEMVRCREIKAKNFFTFSYEFDERRNVCRPREADVFLKLSPSLLAKKRKIISEIYGFRKLTFEFKTLSNRECFRRLI